jgi:hypothetical protein
MRKVKSLGLDEVAGIGQRDVHLHRIHSFCKVLSWVSNDISTNYNRRYSR